MTYRRGGILLALALAACTSYSPELRRQQATAAVQAAGWESVRLPTERFVLAGFVPRDLHTTDTLTIYIEGDGLAWIDRTQVSLDPTPLHPVGLELALRDPRGHAAYLARPCQYVSGDERRNCAATWWTDRRFAPEVVTAGDQAVTQLKQRFKARRLVLIGYSGGGAIAALIAARRGDVAQLVTVAGNLDPERWARQHRVTPLRHSLNPADAWRALVNIPQVHFVGGKDRVVGRDITESYRSRFPKDRQPVLRVIDGFDHECCWAEQWPMIYPIM